MNISSHVIRVAPENLERAAEMLRQSGLCDVFFLDPRGTIVVTIEGKDVGEQMDKMRAVQKLPLVLSAALAFSYSEDGPDQAGVKTSHGDGALPGGLREA